MTIIRSNKLRIYPDREQESILIQRMGASRFVWNWSLAKWKDEYEAGNKPSAYGLAKIFRANRPEWFYELDNSIIDRVTSNLGSAFKSFFNKKNNYPKFKKKGCKDSYQVKASEIFVSSTHIRAPKMSPIKLARPVFREGNIIGNVTFSFTAGRWYVSIPVEMQENTIVCESQTTVGVDLGITTFATLSNGEKFVSPKPLIRAGRRLAIRQRRLSRKEKDSKNYKKAVKHVNRLHTSVANKRKGFIHKLTSHLAIKYKYIAIEDLDVKGLLTTKLAAKRISDSAFSEFRRQIEYKAMGRVYVVDRFFPKQ